MLIYRDRNQDTICAVSTPHGVGGISVIRISGNQAAKITRKIAPFLSENLESNRVYYGHLEHDSEQVDEVLIAYFSKGRSFTGEEVLEISCHGSPIICQKIVNLLVYFGARPAERGEFTFRAFNNKRIDLSQAEAVLGLIESQSQQSAKMSLRQLGGVYSNYIETLESDIIWIIAHLEAGIDFSTEGIEIISNEGSINKIKLCLENIEGLLSTYSSGKILKDGINVAILGPPNAGKSSLLNLLTQEEVAIVDDTPGTTRDLIKSDIIFNGIKITFNDTAGIRSHTNDRIEKMGIEKSILAGKNADVIVLVLDANFKETHSISDFIPKEFFSKTMVLLNKIDLITDDVTIDKSTFLSRFFTNIADFGQILTQSVHFITTTDYKYREFVLKQLTERCEVKDFENKVIVSNARHYECLISAKTHLNQALNTLNQNFGSEFATTDLKFSLQAVQEIVGKHFDDQILDRVFKEFCIGK